MAEPTPRMVSCPSPANRNAEMSHYFPADQLKAFSDLHRTCFRLHLTSRRIIVDGILLEATLYSMLRCRCILLHSSSYGTSSSVFLSLFSQYSFFPSLSFFLDIVLQKLVAHVPASSLDHSSIFLSPSQKGHRGTR